MGERASLEAISLQVRYIGASSATLPRTPTMDKGLPTTVGDVPAQRPRSRSRRAWRLLVAIISLAVIQSTTNLFYTQRSTRTAQVPTNAQEILDKCALLDVKPGPPPDFNLRQESDRFVAGTPPTLIKVGVIGWLTLSVADDASLQDASIWTGGVDGLEVVRGDVLLDGGLIKRVGHIEQAALDAYNDLVIVDAAGAWVSPGCV